MLLFGITGGIGSGKSAVSDLLREMGIPVIAADAVARELTVTLLDIRTALIAAFGTGVYTESGGLNKERMRELVFSDAGARARINSIIHPHVFSWIRTEAKRLHDEEGHLLAGVEAALVYESGMQTILNKVVVVDAPLAARTNRLQQRDGLSVEDIHQRFAAQMPVGEKKKLADFLVENSGDLLALRAEVDKLHNWLLTMVRQGVCGAV